MNTKEPAPVVTSVGDSIGTITVSRPKAMNALNRDVLEKFLDALTDHVADPDVRVILLAGAGDQAFIAGADINEFVGANVSDALAIAERIRRVTDLMVGCPKPIVASIHGYCLGGGMELALAADIRIASITAKFGLPEIKLGILPGGGGTVRLTKIAGASVAKQMAMIGDPIDAERAFSLGLLYAVHPPERLADQTDALCAKLASRPPFALAQLKSSLNIAVDSPSANALDTEIKAFALCYSTMDKEEGVRAFLEKRSPVFQGH